MATQNFLPYTRQSISLDDISEASQALTQELITRGPRVEHFEKAMAQYCGAKYGVAFNSGTAALMGACRAAELTAFDRFITTPNSFVATTGAGIACQAAPIFIDIDPTTGNMDLQQLEYNLNTQSSRGRTFILPVHFAGIPVDMEALDRMNKNPDCIIIEDAAHALGSSYANGEKVGSSVWSDMTIFSFHPAKIMTTGEGGMVMTNNDELYHKLKRARNNGIERDPDYMFGEIAPWTYEVHEITGNYNFTEFQAALGLSQMARLESFILKRRELIKVYRELLKDISHVKMLSEEYDNRTAFHLCVVQIDFSAYNKPRAQVMNSLKERGIGTQVHYIPIYRFPFLSNKIGDISEYFPKMESYYSKALSLPLYYDLKVEDVERVVKSLKEVLLNE